MVSFDVPITDDKISESVENFMLTINQTSLLTESDVGTPVEIIVTIVDDECKYKTRFGNWYIAFISYLLATLFLITEVENKLHPFLVRTSQYHMQ